ncbi:dockerin type I domain-containing protein [Ruminococcus bromii]|uniref:dockerin type I domain-containing protein n=1 Tax=Ruminococcus bromii TaxID=40518 RepID=UPI0039F622F6
MLNRMNLIIFLKTMLRILSITRYIAKWNGIKIINDQASDVNYDGKVNAKDRMILTRHLAKWQEYEILPNNK